MPDDPQEYAARVAQYQREIAPIEQLLADCELTPNAAKQAREAIWARIMNEVIGKRLGEAGLTRADIADVPGFQNEDHLDLVIQERAERKKKRRATLGNTDDLGDAIRRKFNH